MDNENKEENLPAQEVKSTSKTFFFIAVAACVLSAVAFGLSFSKLGIYALISSVLFEFASLAFCRAQKKKNYFQAIKIVVIITYVLLALSLALFVGGLVYSATK